MIMVKITKNIEHSMDENHILEHWLEHRQELIDDYQNLTGSHQEQLEENVANFCNNLIDYTSEGYFEVYGLLEKENQNINQFLNNIKEDTDTILHFNDTCTKQRNPEQIKKELSNLGEKLVHQFKLEDKLLQEYLTHRKQ